MSSQIDGKQAMNNMKQLLIITGLLLNGMMSDAQNSIPEETLFNLSGNQISSVEALNHDGPVLLVFWTITCHNMIDGLIDINDDYYDDWKEEFGLKIVALSVDDERNRSKIGPFVNGKDWDFDVYTDPNRDFMRVMNVNIHPHLFLINKEKKVVWQKTSYLEGDENILYEELKKLN